MSGTGLPARILYALGFTPVGCVAGFYVGVYVFTRLIPLLEGISDPAPGWADFVFSLLVGVGAGFSVFFYALTLPRHRLRRRGGRVWRLVWSALLVFVVAVTVQVEGVPLRYTVGLMLWLSLTLTFTFVRYGVLDKARRKPPDPPTGGDKLSV